MLVDAEHQRLALAMDGPLDAPEEDDGIAAADAGLLAALEGRERTVRSGQPPSPEASAMLCLPAQMMAGGPARGIGTAEA